MREAVPFQPHLAIGALVEEKVRFVLIGGYAAQLLGSPVLTGDVDVCYARDNVNLERLARALIRLGASLRGAPAGLPFRIDARTLQNGDAFTFDTTAGAFDILGIPAGTEGYDQLERNATTVHVLDDLEIRVASIDDLMRMKRAAGRAKDLYQLEHLAALRDILDKRGRQKRVP